MAKKNYEIINENILKKENDLMQKHANLSDIPVKIYF